MAGGREWTVQEIEILRRGIAEGKSRKEVAIELNRSPHAVSSKARELRERFRVVVKGDLRQRRKMSALKVKALRQLRELDWEFEVIAEVFGISPSYARMLYHGQRYGG